MKNGTTDKLFDLIYTDSMTELYSRVAYDERLKQLRRGRTTLDNMTAAVVCLTDLKQMTNIYGQHTSDEIVKIVADTLKKTIGEKADIYRICDNEFVCVSDSDIRSYMVQFIKLVKFENKDRYFKVNVAVGYGAYDNRKHKGIDDLIKYCEQKMFVDKRRKRQG